MGMASAVIEGFRPPAWIEKYPNITHCSNCDAVYNSTAKFVRAQNISISTMPTQWMKIGNCVEGACPFCNKIR